MPHHDTLQYMGAPIFFAGTTYLVPSLSVLQFRQNVELLQSPPQGDTPDAIGQRFDALIPIIGMALRRNYPEVTDEFLGEHLDVTTFILALRAVQNASGMKAVTPGEFRSQATA